MLTRGQVMPFVTVLVVACGRSGTPERDQHPPPQAVADAQSADVTLADAKVESPAKWRIESGRVGDLELGKRIPQSLLVPDLAERYVARYIADGQPVDAFRLDAPPVLIVLEKGPWRTAGKTAEPTANPPTERYKKQAVAVARSGVAVGGIMVMSAGAKTVAGVGVGSTLDELKRAYPDLYTSGFPATLGNDSCVARTQSLDGVAFLFTSCDKAKQGAPVIRVDLWPDA